MNIFNQYIFSLFFMAFLVRSFQWLIWLHPGVPINPSTDENDTSPVENNIGMSISLRAFLLTYPSMNILIIALLITFSFMYDSELIRDGRRTNLIMRIDWKFRALVMIIFFTVLIYGLCLSFFSSIENDKRDGFLFKMYNFIMVLELVAAFNSFYMITIGVHKFRLQRHPEFGREVK